MPRPDYTTCRSCGKHRNEVGKLSHQRLCEDCGRKRLNRNLTGLTTKRGLAWRRWQIGIAAGIGAVLLDDVNDDVHTGDHA